MRATSMGSLFVHPTPHSHLTHVASAPLVCPSAAAGFGFEDLRPYMQDGLSLLGALHMHASVKRGGGGEGVPGCIGCWVPARERLRKCQPPATGATSWFVLILLHC